MHVCLFLTSGLESQATVDKGAAGPPKIGRTNGSENYAENCYNLIISSLTNIQ